MNKKLIFINTASQVIVRFITLIFALISIKLLSNYLGTKGVGEFNTVNTYINFFIVIADLGLFSVAVREISQNPNNENKIISNVFIIRLISAIIACIIAIFIIYLTNYSAHIKMGVLIGSGYLFLNLMASIYDVILQYRLKMQFSAIAELVSKMVALSALFFMVKINAGFFWIMSTVVLSGIVIFAIKAIFGTKFHKIKIKYDKNLSKWLFRISWPIGIVFIVNNMYFKIDSLMLFAIKGAEPVGIYSVAYKILDVIVFMGAYFASALKPTLSENIKKDVGMVRNIVEKAFLVMLLISIPIVIPCLVFSKDIILFISNSDFISGANALILLSLTLPVIYFDLLFGEILLAEDRRKLLIAISIFVLSLNIMLNLIFIPKYSFMGAAVVTLVSELILLAINFYFTHRSIKYRINWSKVSLIMMSGSISLAVAFWLRSMGLYFVISSSISMIVYLFFSYVFKIIDINSIKSLVTADEK